MSDGTARSLLSVKITAQLACLLLARMHRATLMRTDSEAQGVVSGKSSKKHARNGLLTKMQL